MDTTPGIDLHGQDVANAPLQVGLAKKNGVAFVVAKATQGVSFVDPAYREIRTQCATVGDVLFGAYHFFQPGDDPVAQAQFFVKTATPVKGDLRPMLDVEPVNGLNPDPQEAHACAMEIDRLTGIYPWVYSSADFYLNNLKDLFVEGPIWLALYPDDSPGQYMASNQRYFYQTLPWPDMWQYSKTQYEPGTPAPLDGDYYLDTLADLKSKHVIA